MVAIDIRKAVRDLNKEYKQLSDNERANATARAINRAVVGGITISQREVRKIYKIRAKDVKRTIITTKASPTRPEGKFVSTGRSLPIFGFGASKTKKGIGVNIMGQRKYFPGAFIITMKNGHKGVFARAKYEGNKLVSRRKRINEKGNDLPITEVQTLAVPSGIANKVVLPNLTVAMQERFVKEYSHELKFRTERVLGLL
jgi:hypothetical protein